MGSSRIPGARYGRGDPGVVITEKLGLRKVCGAASDVDIVLTPSFVVPLRADARDSLPRCFSAFFEVLLRAYPRRAGAVVLRCLSEAKDAVRTAKPSASCHSRLATL